MLEVKDMPENFRAAAAAAELNGYRNVLDTLSQREKTLDILNRVALVLLTRKEASFAGAMADGLGLIAEIADIDRMSVFRNSEQPDGLYVSQIYRWRKDVNGTVDVWKDLKNVPYSRIAPRLEPILAAGECVNGHIDQLPGTDSFKKYGCETILVIPVFDDGKFWGATLFERLNDACFTETETDVLRSASFMLANAVIRNEEAAIVRQASEQSQLMLDTVPLAAVMWDEDLHVLACSQSTLRMFGFEDKQDAVARLPLSMPPFQPDGTPSYQKMARNIATAFEQGYCRTEFTHLATDGQLIVCDVSLYRMEHKGGHVVLAYARDIRDEKKMLDELAGRDEMLAAQAHWYKSLLDGIPLPISVTDADMNLTFTNAAAEKVFSKKREDLLGQPCSVWNCPVCSTENCSIVRAKQGYKQNFFKIYDRSWKVDSEEIHDIAGETIGYLEVLHDVTEVEHLARRQADAANEAKSAFLAQMSHEMRTPLSAVIGLSELLLENGKLSEEHEAYLDKIYNAGSTLLSIVNDILDISKIEAGKFEIVLGEYDVPNLINDTVAQNILRIHSKPVRFSLDISEDAPRRLLGDDIRVKQILSNLLSNAFKYTDEGAVELRISFERDGDSVWTTFRVRDTGIGIRPEDIGLLFADYSRFDSEANRKNGGTGLGLSITKRLVNLMGGTVTVQSEYGKGSVFTAKIRQQVVNDAVIGEKMAGHLRSFRYTTNRRRSGAQLNRVRLPFARVLVVDDNQINLDIARGLMSPYGMEIDCVTSGAQAVDAVRGEARRYSAIFMDHMMPGMDGVEAVRIIREEIGSDYAKTVPIIALTANALVGSRERFVSQGFNAFVSKPIDIFRLDEVIRRWIWEVDRKPNDLAAPPERRRRQDRRKGGDRRRAERRKGAGASKTAQAIEGLCWEKGLRYFGGADAYRQILRSFAVNTRGLLNAVSNPAQETLRQYAITVHGIKSSARGVCAEALGDAAESLEIAAKEGDLDFVMAHNPAFLASAEKLTGDIEAFLAGREIIAARPRREKPADAELARLRVACEEYDMDGIEAALREMERYEYTADNGLMRQLREDIAGLRYAQVVEKIVQATDESRRRQ